jgi:predicted transcriptional regulator
MPHHVEKENITIAVPIDILELLDDLCGRKDMNRTQIVVRAIKAYLALEASRDCSLFASLHEELEKRQNEK